MDENRFDGRTPKKVSSRKGTEFAGNGEMLDIQSYPNEKTLMFSVGRCVLQYIG